MNNSEHYQLGFIGCGNMARAIAAGAIKGDAIRAGAILGANPGEINRQAFANLGCDVTTDNKRVLDDCEQVVLAVKPQKFVDIAPLIAQHARPNHILISVMAGLSSTHISELIGRQDLRIIRTMPNTPLQVGAGCCGIALGAGANAGDESLTMRILSASGKAFLVDEAHMDAVCALSGSGPAYLFYLAESLMMAAEHIGLSPDQARDMTRQTLLGAAMLLDQSDESAAELRRRVTSPNGTTQAATDVFDSSEVKAIVKKALEANVRRSGELRGNI